MATALASCALSICAVTVGTDPDGVAREGSGGIGMILMLATRRGVGAGAAAGLTAGAITAATTGARSEGMREASRCVTVAEDHCSPCNGKRSRYPFGTGRL